MMNKKFKRVLAALLTFLFVFSSFSTLSTASYLFVDASNENEPYILLDGEKVTEVVLEENAKLRLFAVSPKFEGNYNWQIAHPDEEDLWVDISMNNSDSLWLTSALVMSMSNNQGESKLRCRISNGEEEVFTYALKVLLSYNISSNETEATISGVPQRMRYSLRATANETSTPKTTYTVIINYLFDDNTIAFEPYGATLAAGSDFKETITSPPVVGYKPVRRVGDEYIDATTISLNITNIKEDVVINVIYEPDFVDFSIHHHKQEIYTDLYSDTPDDTTTGKALTGTIVGDGLAKTEEEWPGFKALAYERLPVAADGSTNIEIRYDRKYFLVQYDMNGGYGCEPVYTRYESSVGVNNPTRHGYIFAGWELVSYGGEAPTEEQKARYDINNGKVITVPAANLKYKAIWRVGETKYTMVFWAENADDSGYSYWGNIDNISAMSGDIVSARDLIGQVDGIDDEAYFEFNEQKSDKNVIVEGDGSTVVNVYYTRKLYTITFKAKGNCIIDAKHTHIDSCYEAICGKGHTHDSTCVSTLTCDKPVHVEHTDACIICGKENHVHGSVGCDCNLQEHTHSKECWGNLVGSASNKPSKAPANPENGQICHQNGKNYYIYLYGQWYKYNGSGVWDKYVVPATCGLDEHKHGTGCSCLEEEHVHTDDCYKDELHNHVQDCYTYSCGVDEHIHVDGCYRLVCAQPTGHTHTSTCTSSTGSNTVLLVKEKYGKFIGDLWPIKDGNNVTYNNGQRWSPSSSSFYSAVLVYIAQMPPDDFTLTVDSGDGRDTYTMKYYLEALEGGAYDETVGNVKYKLNHTIVAKYNYLTKAEDFFDIKGFVQESSNPAYGSDGKIDKNGGAEVKMYYKRKRSTIEFSNYGTILSDKTQYNVPYGADISEYNFVPPYPQNLEVGAYQFAGWYTSPGCYEGSEVNWETATMDANNMLLYAKWVPSVHNVRVFLDANKTQQLGETQVVNHGSFAVENVENVSNNGMVFQGWFYVGEDGKEKAFVFNAIPIIDDVDVYAKWSSHVSVQYKVYYKLKGTNIEVADSTISTAIVGNNKTFPAKAGNELYAAYREGYYPDVNSHTVTMSLTGNREFTFWYTYVEKMPYKVLYLGPNGEVVHQQKIVADNRHSVVTETFQKVNGMMPDAYQKRLVLSTEGEDKDGDGVLDNNVIIFNYNNDTQHAYYRVVHYVQNLTGDSYREFRSEETVGIIGTTYTINPITVNGFKYQYATVNGVKTEANSISAELGADGMLIELYYNRANVSYIVQYEKRLEDGSFVSVAPEKTGIGVFGAQVIEYALDLSANGYELESAQLQMLTLSWNSESNVTSNVIKFLYKEANVSIKYEVVGPENCGYLSISAENIKAISGVANGSKPTANNGFIFVGWYLDAHCTQPVDSALVNDGNKLVPVQQNGVWKAATYYAKFEALQTDLTISTNSVSYNDKDQAFLFTVKGKAGTDTANVNITVAIVGNGSVTITELPVGDYTIINHTEWSWRFGGASNTQITLQYHDGSNQISYAMARTNDKWLDGNNGVNNNFNN